MIEEEIDQILRKQPTLKTSFEQNTSTHLPIEPCYLEPENKLVHQLKEKQTDNPICLIGEIVNTNDYPILISLIYDDEFQTETNHAGQPTVDQCHEFHYH